MFTRNFLFLCLFCLITPILMGISPLMAGSRTVDVLNQEERAWLQAHDGKIRLAPCPDWEPMEIFEADGTYRGFVADYMHLIEKKLDFKFDLIRVDSWPEIQKMVKEKQLDVISSSVPTPERRTYMNWTQSYYKSKNAIVARKTLKGTLSLKRLIELNMVVGVPKGYDALQFYTKKYPDLKITYVETALDGLKQIAFGEIDAVIAEVPHTLYYLQRFNIKNLRIVELDDYYTVSCIGVRKDWPILYSIMKKGLSQISKQEREEILQRWGRIPLIKLYYLRSFWYVVGALTIIITAVLLWNKSLKNKVAQRTEELNLNEMRLEALLELHRFKQAPFEEIIEFTCKKAVLFTESQFGYLAFSGGEDFIFTKNMVQKLPSRTKNGFHASAKFPIETIGFWKDAIKKQAPVVANSYSETNPDKRGLPAEYKDIERYMNAPVIHNGKIVAVAGVGNKKSNYTDSDIQQLSLLVEGMWNVLEHKKDQGIIQSSIKLFQGLVENSLAGLSIIQDGRIVYSNPEQQRLSGILRPLESDHYDHITQEDRKKVKAFYYAIKTGVIHVSGIHFSFSLDDAGEDNEPNIKWVNCRASKTEYKGRPAVLLNSIDVTRTKEMERLLLVQEKMASLGHIAAGIAHEIRNPLAGIGIHLRNLEKKYMGDQGVQEKINTCFRLIHSDTARIESVIRRTLDFAKPAACSFAIVDINQAVRKAVELTAVTLRKQQIAIECNLRNDIPKCKAEFQLIEDVIYNLIINASDAMKEMTTGKKIKVSSSVNEQFIIVVVDDTGPGVPLHLREKIFDPFFTTKDYSTGIGLGICSRIISDHGGTIKNVSNQWRGARFVIKLPVFNHKKES